MTVRIFLFLLYWIGFSFSVLSKGRLFVLSIGISDYLNPHNDPELDLKFAAKDAQDVGLLITGFAPTMFSKEPVIKVLINETATVNNILKTLHHFINAYTPTSEDLLFLFISSHGWLDGANLFEDKGRFYIRTYEFNEKELVFSALSFIRLWETVNLALWQKICLIDACHSEGAIPLNFTLLNQHWFNNSLFLLSCKRNQKSQEDVSWQNGAFTYLFKQGISGGADLNNDRKVTFFELEQFLFSKTPILVTRAGYPKQNPVIYNKINSFSNYYFVY